MSVPVPDLDDRSWPDLVKVAVDRLAQVDPAWRADLSVHDPAVVLIDAFAHVTDVLLYRLNRVPQRMYAVFLNFVGAARLHPPAAATVDLRFSRTDGAGVVTVPAGTRVSVAETAAGGQPLFRTTAAARMSADVLEVVVPAVDAEPHDAEAVGTGNGLSGQRMALAHPPALSGPVRVAVEAEGEDVDPGDGVVVDGHPYRYWRAVDTFADAGAGDAVFVLDRVTGTVTFAPALDLEDGRAPAPMALVPAEGRAVRAWYSTGGGARGNVAAQRLTVLRDPLPGGVTVTNPGPATGGRDAEDPAQAAVRAPQEFHTRRRAVTARDYELLAKAASADVARARASTRNELWSFAQPGEVEVVLVPALAGDDSPDGRIDAETMRRHQREDVRTEVLTALQDSAPLGAGVVVGWADYKTVSVAATVFVRPSEDIEAVRRRILARLYAAISPLPAGPSSALSGSSFGRSLHTSNLYPALQQQEPGVTHVADVRFLLDEVPSSDVRCISTDAYQRDTWFAGSGAVLFRTGNAAASWEPVGRFPGETVDVVACHTPAADRPGAVRRPGHVVVVTTSGRGSRVHASADLGEHWVLVAEVAWGVHDVTWVERDGAPMLLLAGDAGLYEAPPEQGATPLLNVVDPANTTAGSYAVESFTDYRGQQGVVVAQQASGGVWVSVSGGSSGTFAQVRTAREDVRTVAVQYDGVVTYLWAARADSDASVNGCVRLRVDDLASLDASRAAAAWEPVDAGWSGGECWDVAFGGPTAYAASQGGGVLALDLTDNAAQWSRWPVDSGLPPRESAPPPFEPVLTVATDAAGTVVLAGGGAGVFRLGAERGRWELCSSPEVRDTVPLPANYLFCSGEHDIDVRVEG